MAYTLNYHHLYYFFVIAREGSIARAAKLLRLSQPTLSTQLKSLEDGLQVKLFERKSRSLILTESGASAFEYAREIFAIGIELQGVLQGRSANLQPKLRIGVMDSFPKLLTYQLLQPLMNLNPPAQLICLEGKRADLLSELARHSLDLILTDAAIDLNTAVRAYNHFLGECSMLLMGAPGLAKAARLNFPQSLHKIPVLLPAQTTIIRRSIDNWFEKNEISPKIAAEFEDSALMKIFARESEGLIFVPDSIEAEARKSFGLRLVARLPEIVEPIYLISLERRVQHPLVVKVLRNAKRQLSLRNRK